jgi:hypothetical protein
LREKKNKNKNIEREVKKEKKRERRKESGGRDLDNLLGERPTRVLVGL